MGVCSDGIACGIEGVPLSVALLIAQGHCTTWVGIALLRRDETGDTFARPSERWLETGVAFARAGRASNETAIAFAGEKWLFFLCFSIA